MSGPRVVRAPRGPQLRTRGWLQEAALRCLMNNLDPEVAERPDDLVVYGGRGKAARNWEAFDAIVRSLEALGDDETLLVQSGKPVGVFRTHRHGAPRADRQQPAGARLGRLGALLGPGGGGPDHVRADDRRVLDLHRHPGDPAGHLSDLRRRGGAPLRRQPQGDPHPDRRPRGHGRGPAAGRHHERGGGPDRGGGPGPHPPPPGDPLPRHHGRQPGRGGGPGPGGQAGGAGAVDRRRGQCRRGLPRTAAPRRGDRHRHRPDLGPRPAERLRAGGVLARGRRRPAGEGPRRLRRRGPRLDGPALRGHGRLPEGRGRGLRLRQQPAGRGRARRASPTPSPTRDSSPPTCARCSAKGRAPSAGWR